MPIYTDTDMGPGSPTLNDFPSSLTQSLGAAVGEAYSGNPSTLGVDALELARANAGAERVDKDAAKQRIADAGVKLEVPESGYSTEALDMLIQRKQDEARRRDILARAPSGLLGSGARFTASLLTGLTDPLNVAASFIPGIGEANAERMMTAAGKSVLARAGARAQIGAVSGLVGNAALEPFVYGLHSQLHDDYTMGDALTNLAFGAMMGGGLHVVGGGIADALKSAEVVRRVPDQITAPRSAADVAGMVDPETRRAALSTAVADMAQGRLPEVELLVRSDPAARGLSDLVTLYRAESPTVRFDDVFDREGLQEFASDKPGTRFTDDPNYADYFRKSYGPDAVVRSITVPRDVAEAGRLSGYEYRIDEGSLQVKARNTNAGRTPGQINALRAIADRQARPEAVALGDVDASRAADAPSSPYSTAVAEMAEAAKGRDVRAMVNEGQLTPLANNALVGVHEAGTDANRLRALVAHAERIARADPTAMPADVMADAVERVRTGKPVQRGALLAAAEDSLAKHTARMEQMRANLEAGGMDPQRVSAMVDTLAPFDEQIRNSQSLGDAARAAALCGLT